MAKNKKTAFDVDPEELTNFSKDVTGTRDKMTTGKSDKTETGESDKKKGRPPLKDKRVPFTTSLNESLIKAIKLAAVEAGKRPADLINEVLKKHFKT